MYFYLSSLPPIQSRPVLSSLCFKEDQTIFFQCLVTEEQRNVFFMFQDCNSCCKLNHFHFLFRFCLIQIFSLLVVVFLFKFQLEWKIQEWDYQWPCFVQAVINTWYILHRQNEVWFCPRWMAAGEFNSSMPDCSSCLDLLLGINVLPISKIDVLLFITFWKDF